MKILKNKNVIEHDPSKCYKKKNWLTFVLWGLLIAFALTSIAYNGYSILLYLAAHRPNANSNMTWEKESSKLVVLENANGTFVRIRIAVSANSRPQMTVFISNRDTREKEICSHALLGGTTASENVLSRIFCLEIPGCGSISYSLPVKNAQAARFSLFKKDVRNKSVWLAAHTKEGSCYVKIFPAG